MLTYSSKAVRDPKRHRRVGTPVCTRMASTICHASATRHLARAGRHGKQHPFALLDRPYENISERPNAILSNQTSKRSTF